MIGVVVGVAIIIASEILYILTDIRELQYGTVVGMIFILIGIIQVMNLVGMSNKKEGEKTKKP